MPAPIPVRRVSVGRTGVECATSESSASVQTMMPATVLCRTVQSFSLLNRPWCVRERYLPNTMPWGSGTRMLMVDDPHA